MLVTEEATTRRQYVAEDGFCLGRSAQPAEQRGEVVLRPEGVLVLVAEDLPAGLQDSP